MISKLIPSLKGKEDAKNARITPPPQVSLQEPFPHSFSDGQGILQVLSVGVWVGAFPQAHNPCPNVQSAIGIILSDFGTMSALISQLFQKGSMRSTIRWERECPPSENFSEYVGGNMSPEMNSRPLDEAKPATSWPDMRVRLSQSVLL